MTRFPTRVHLMHSAGVVVSFNSDDHELGRRLNLEAAKAVKYGGLAPEEALKFVTMNPARQLRIEQFVGSLEAGQARRCRGLERTAPVDTIALRTDVGRRLPAIRLE